MAAVVSAVEAALGHMAEDLAELGGAARRPLTLAQRSGTGCGRATPSSRENVKKSQALGTEAEVLGL